MHEARQLFPEFEVDRGDPRVRARGETLTVSARIVIHVTLRRYLDLKLAIEVDGEHHDVYISRCSP